MALGMGVAVGSAPAVASSSEPNPNLLRWTEEMDNAVWAPTGVTVTPDADGVAEELVFGLSGGDQIVQRSETAATTGAAAIQSVAPTTEYVRYSKSGTFDGLSYTVSVSIKAAAGDAVSLQLYRAGGFLEVALVSNDDAAGRDIFAKEWKLEQGSLTDYVHRTT